jgi:hypothetical protein
MARKPKVAIKWEENKMFAEKFRHYIATIGHTIGLNIRNKLFDKAASIVEGFYNEYQSPPRKYTRHTERGFEKSGYEMALYRYFKSPGGYKNTRQITIDVGWVTTNMYDDYGYDPDATSYSGMTAQEAVLQSFIEGYHGDPSYGISAKYYPQMLYDYLDELLSPMSVDLMVAEAVNKADRMGIFK